MEEDNNELKTMFSGLDGHLLYKSNQMKAKSLRLKRLDEHNMKISAENESIRVTRREIILLPTNRLRPKRFPKATNMAAESLDEQYVGICLHMESMSSVWCVKVVAELHHFSTYPR